MRDVTELDDWWRGNSSSNAGNLDLGENIQIVQKAGEKKRHTHTSDTTLWGSINQNPVPGGRGCIFSLVFSFLFLLVSPLLSLAVA